MNKKYICALFLITVVFGCLNNDQNKKKIIMSNFGLRDYDTDSLSIEIEPKNFTSWKEFINKIDKIVCKDSLAKIVLENDNNIKYIYLRNPCWENFACIRFRNKNFIEIHNGIIVKSMEYSFPLDSVKNVLKRDLNNHGKNPDFCDNPEKYIIFISYDNDSNFDSFVNILNKLTTTYSEISNDNVMNIILKEKIDLIPPP